MDRYLIIADDFTGANDTGVQLKRRGIDTKVVFSSKLINTGLSSFVIDTESRGLSGEEAYSKVKDILSGIDFSEFKYVIKKVDSTLRGNIAEEIKAVDDLYQSELIIFAPAFPDLKRTTVDGVHMLDNVPITKTEMAKDPIKPVKEDNIAAILREVYREEVVHIPLDRVRSGNIVLSEARVYTFDASTNMDIRNIIKAGLNTGKRILWVGTAGLADNLLEIQNKTAPVLSVVGSLSNVTREQVKYAEQNGMALVKIPVYNVIEGRASADLYIKEAVDSLMQGKDTMVLSSASYASEEYIKADEAGERKGMSKEEISRFTQNLISSISKKVLENAQISGVFLTGGDTARGFFEQVGALGSSIVGEIAIGVPLMKLVGGPFEGLIVVTKAGAFGNKDIIVYAARKLKEVIE